MENQQQNKKEVKKISIGLLLSWVLRLLLFDKKEVKKISAGFLLGWVLGLLFAITGIVSLFFQPLIAFLCLLLAAVLLPSVNKLVEKKLNFSLSWGLKFIIVIILLIVIVINMGASGMPGLR